MENISVKQVLSENNISIENFRVLLLQNSYEVNISKESLIPIEVYNSIKDNINSNEPTSIYSNNRTELYSDDNNSTQAYTINTENTTEAYGSTDSKGTVAYDSNIDNSSGESKTLNHGIGIGDNIILKDKNYKIIEIISEGTGEAVIYKVENDSRNIYVLKLYFWFSNSKHEPNYETLERIKFIEHKDILRLIDFGVGTDKFQEKYCFEISEYAKGGDLLNVSDFKKKYTSSFIENNVIPEIFDGIKQLHSNKIYHCDLKPGNIFYLDDEQNDLVIGDYGSAKAYDLGIESDVIKTSMVKTSNFYLAPELGAGNGFVSSKADYFSFGMILLHLLYPELITKNENCKDLDKSETNKIGTRGFSSKELLEYKPKYSRINKLIAGLTLYVSDNRWGEDEVEKWIKKQDSELNVKYLNADNTNLAIINISGDREIKNEEQLIEFIFNNKDWKKELLDDKPTKKELNNWLNVNHKKDKRLEINKIFKYTETLDAIDKDISKSEDIDYTKQAFIRYLKPKFPIEIEGTVFNITEGNINENVNKLILKLDKVWQTFSIEKTRSILFQLEFSLKQLLKSSNGNVAIVLQTILDKIYSSLQITSNDYTGFQSEITKALKVDEEDISLIKILNLLYNFNDNRVFNFNNNKCNTIEELGLYVVNNENDFENKYFKVEKNCFLKKKSNENLSTLNSKELVFEIFKNDAKSTIEYIYLTFDKHRDYIINYKYYKSLTDFLRDNKVSKDYTSRSENNETYNTKRNLFDKFGSVAQSFLRTVKQKHNISNLSRSNESNISSRIVSDSWKRYIKVYQGQFTAAGCLILLLVVIGFYRLNNIYTLPPRVNNTQPTYQPSKPVNQYAYIKADPIGNIRSGTSPNTNILTSLPKGEKVFLIEQDKATEWYKIRYGDNNYGYVSDVVVSFDFVSKNNNSRSQTTTSSNTSNKGLLKNNMILGKWDVFDNQNNDAEYTFNSNGTGIFTGNNSTKYPFRWSITNNGNELKIVLNNDNSVWNWKINSVSQNEIKMFSDKQNISRVIKKKNINNVNNVSQNEVKNIKLVSKINNTSGNIMLTKNELLNAEITVFAGNNKMKASSFQLEFDTQPGTNVNGNLMDNRAKKAIEDIRVGEKIRVKNIKVNSNKFNSSPTVINIELISEIKNAKNIVNGISNYNQLLGSWTILIENSKYIFDNNNRGKYIDNKNKIFSFEWSLKNNNTVLKIVMDSDKSIWRWEIINPNNNAIKLKENSKNITRTIVKR
jgi:serine/threonine protein kinase